MSFKTNTYYEIEVHAIDVPEGRRAINEKTVVGLMESMARVGLLSPIPIRNLTLVAGAHRLEAARRLGWKLIYVRSVKGLSDEEVEMVEISENLHRAELTALERAEQIERWRVLNEARKVAQSAPPSGGAQPAEAGIRETARELGVSRRDVERAREVAGLSDEAKEAARETGLDKKQGALISIAGLRTAAAQVEHTHRIKAAGRVVPPVESDEDAVRRQVAAIMSAWNKAGPEARQRAREFLDEPVMDRRFGAA